LIIGELARYSRVGQKRLGRRMMGIAVSPAAYAAIATALPGSVAVESERVLNGDYFIWLEPSAIDRIAAVCQPGESYSDVILRLAAG